MNNKRLICGVILTVALTIVVVSYGTIIGFSQQEAAKNQGIGVITKSNESPVENNAQQMKDNNVKNNLQKYGIDVVSSIDSDFELELMKYVGEKRELISLVNSAKPFALFIKNNSSKEIVGVSLRWTLNDSKGGILNIPQIEVNPGVLIGIKPVDPRMVGKTSLINVMTRDFLVILV